MIPRRSVVLLLWIALALTAGQARAEGSVVQDSKAGDLVVVNFGLPATLCDLHFTPEPQPAPPNCILSGCLPAPGWSCFLNPFGGADWFANTPGDCIAPGAALSGFGMVLDGPFDPFCCYVVQFTDPTGAVMLQQEECFTVDSTIPVTLSQATVE